MEQVHSIAGKLDVKWVPEVRAILDTWTSYFIPLADFKEAVAVKGLSFAKAHKARAWIVDSSTAKGAFSADIQAYIGTELFPAFAKAGIKCFITITSESAVTKMTVANYSAKAGPSGLKLVEATSATEAIEWLKKNP